MKYWLTKEQLQTLVDAENGNQIFVLCNKIAREQKLITERIESLTKGIVQSLVIFNDYYEGKPLHLQSLPLTKNQYNNFQKLQYHGLVSHVRTGYWDITATGKAFLQGDPVAKSVTIDNGTVIARSPKKTTLAKLLNISSNTHNYPQRKDYL